MSGEQEDFTTDDLNSIGNLSSEEQNGSSEAEKETQDTTPEAEATGEGDQPARVEPDPESEPKAKAKQAKAKEEESEDEPKVQDWPDDWRERMAEHYAAGDKKAYNKELKRLQRFTNPNAVYGTARELEGKFTGGGLLKVPGKGATDEEVADFHKALGVPEKSSEYFDLIQLENGAVIGEADKPLADSFAEAVHGTGATPETVSAALNWYYQTEQGRQADMDEMDEENHIAATRELREEMGGAYNRTTNAIATLFQTAPGGTDIENENSLMVRLMAGRMADGHKIGDDPDMIRWLASMSAEVNPAATVVDDFTKGDKSIDEEIKQIESDMRTDRRAYFKDNAKQERYRKLIEARDKIQAKA